MYQDTIYDLTYDSAPCNRLGHWGHSSTQLGAQGGSEACDHRNSAPGRCFLRPSSGQITLINAPGDGAERKINCSLYILREIFKGSSPVASAYFVPFRNIANSN